MDPWLMGTLVLLVFSNRYLVGAWLRWQRKWYPQPLPRATPLPTVAVVVPMYNEGASIQRTIASLLGLDYPQDKLDIVVVDDCSRDDSLAWAQRAAAGHPQVHVLQNAVNVGKRCSINHAVEQSTAEIILSVDSDVEVEPDALRVLVSGFTDADVAAVGGRVMVRNANVNWLTRMQAIKYYFGYMYLKNIERACDAVLCLSGCLTAYRRHVLLELEPILADRKLLGLPIKYGEDRFLTRQILKAGYRTRLLLAARCSTEAPPKLAGYLSQQLRWRRSNMVDFLGGITHVWKLQPWVALHYVSVAALLWGYPWVVFHHIIDEEFFTLTATHLLLLSLMGISYAIDSAATPAAQRVHPLWFVSLGVLMPVTYLLYTPLAFFTLDSSSWETRGHGAHQARAQVESALGVAACDD